MRQGLRVVLINAVMLVLAGLAVELAFGDWFSQTKIGQLNVRANYDSWFDVSKMYGRAEPVHYTRNKVGLRGDFAANGEVDLLAVGGSTTNQYYVDDAYTWGNILQRDFAAQGRHLVVANAGIDGQSTVGHLLAMEQWLAHIPGLTPKYVLFFVGLNDTFGGGLGPEGGARDTLRNPIWIRAIGDIIRANSALYRLYATAAGMIGAHHVRAMHDQVDSTTIAWVPLDPATATAEPAPPAVLEGYAGRLRQLAELTVRMGARPIFVTQQKASYRRQNGHWLRASSPQFPAEMGPRDFAIMQAFNATTLAVCRQVGGLCIDLGGELEMQPGDYYDYVHTSQQGSIRIGHFLHDRLAPLLDQP